MHNILLVAHNTPLAERVAGILSKEGYGVRRCAEGAMAAREAIRDGTALVLCEVDMPKTTGLQLARLFKGHTRLAHIPFLLLATRMPNPDEMERTGFRIEADDIVRLPTTRWELAAQVAQWLDPDSRPTPISEKMAGPLVPRPEPGRPKSWRIGRVGAVSLSRLLHLVIKDRLSGSLHVRSDDLKLTALISQARVIDVTSSHIPEEDFGNFLIKRMRVSPRDCQRIVESAGGDHRLLGKDLVDRNLLTQNELDHFLTEHKAEKFYGLFGKRWSRAAFEFSPMRIDAVETGMEPVPLERVLVEAILNRADGAEILDTFSKKGRRDRPLHLDEQYQRALRRYNLEPQAIANVTQVDGCSLDELQKKLPRTFDDLLRTAFFLVITRIAQFEPEKKAKEAPPRPAAPEDRVAVDSAPARPVEWNINQYHQAMAKARSMVEHGQYRLARPVVRNALDTHPESSEAMALMAWVNYNLAGPGDMDARTRAKDLLKQSLARDDTNDTAMLYLGRILKDEGKEGLAGAYFERAFSINPANEEARQEIDLIRVRRRRSGPRTS